MIHVRVRVRLGLAPFPQCFPITMTADAFSVWYLFTSRILCMTSSTILTKFCLMSFQKTSSRCCAGPNYET